MINLRRPCAGAFLVASFMILSNKLVQAQQASDATRPEAKFVVPIADIDRSYLRNDVTIQGVITSYKPSWKDTAPHSFVLKDGTGNLRVAVWPNVWAQIPFRDKLKEGTEITARVTIAEFRGALEGHLDKAAQIWLGLAKPGLEKESSGTAGKGQPSATPSPSVPSSAPPITWKTDIGEALQTGKSQKKKILVFFANPDSDNGRYVEEKILGDPRVRALLAEKFVCVRVDMRTQPDLAKQLQAFRAGTIGFYQSDGKPLRSHLVPRTADELLDAMK